LTCFVALTTLSHYRASVWYCKLYTLHVFCRYAYSFSLFLCDCRVSLCYS